MLDGEIGKLTRARGVYTCAEPLAGMPRTVEEPASYSDPKRDAGNDSA